MFVIGCYWLLEAIMLHEPAASPMHDPAVAYKTKLGIWMFASYFAFYATFVMINVWRPLLMARTVVSGLNLATIYGFSLIIIALLQALTYDLLCRRREHAMKQAEEERAR